MVARALHGDVAGHGLRPGTAGSGQLPWTERSTSGTAAVAAPRATGGGTPAATLRGSLSGRPPATGAALPLPGVPDLVGARRPGTAQAVVDRVFAGMHRAGSPPDPAEARDVEARLRELGASWRALAEPMREGTHAGTLGEDDKHARYPLERALADAGACLATALERVPASSLSARWKVRRAALELLFLGRPTEDRVLADAAARLIARGGWSVARMERWWHHVRGGAGPLRGRVGPEEALRFRQAMADARRALAPESPRLESPTAGWFEALTARTEDELRRCVLRATHLPESEWPHIALDPALFRGIRALRERPSAGGADRLARLRGMWTDTVLTALAGHVAGTLRGGSVARFSAAHGERRRDGGTLLVGAGVNGGAGFASETLRTRGVEGSMMLTLHSFEFGSRLEQSVTRQRRRSMQVGGSLIPGVLSLSGTGQRQHGTQSVSSDHGLVLRLNRTKYGKTEDFAARCRLAVRIVMQPDSVPLPEIRTDAQEAVHRALAEHPILLRLALYFPEDDYLSLTDLGSARAYEQSRAIAVGGQLGLRSGGTVGGRLAVQARVQRESRAERSSTTDAPAAVSVSSRSRSRAGALGGQVGVTVGPQLSLGIVKLTADRFDLRAAAQRQFSERGLSSKVFSVWRDGRVVGESYIDLSFSDVRDYAAYLRQDGRWQPWVLKRAKQLEALRSDPSDPGSRPLYASPDAAQRQARLELEAYLDDLCRNPRGGQRYCIRMHLTDDALARLAEIARAWERARVGRDIAGVAEACRRWAAVWSDPASQTPYSLRVMRDATVSVARLPNWLWPGRQSVDRAAQRSSRIVARYRD